MNEFSRLFNVSGLSLDRLRSFLQVAEAGNISRAVDGDPSRQSQFSRQLKELENFFGVSLTRRVGRRIQITADGERLAALLRRHFSELDSFRESMAGRPVSCRIGAAASVLEWSVIPKLGEIRKQLGDLAFEFIQLRTADLARGIDDGSIDFGLVRDDAIGKSTARSGRSLGKIGYALFAPKRAWSAGKTAAEIISKHPMGGLLPGGQFHSRSEEWFAREGLRPLVCARVGSFLQLARMVRTTGAAAILPASAHVDFDPGKFRWKPLAWAHERPMVLLSNPRGMQRIGLSPGKERSLAQILRLGN